MVHLFISPPYLALSLTITDICLSRFIFSEMSYTSNHTVCSLFRLASSTSQYAFKILPYFFMSWQFTHCLLVLNTIPLCGFYTVHLCIHLLKDILCVYVTHSVLYDSLRTHGLLFSCGARAFHCSGFSCGAQALQPRLNSCGPQVQGFPGGTSGKELAYQCRKVRDTG